MSSTKISAAQYTMALDNLSYDSSDDEKEEEEVQQRQYTGMMSARLTEKFDQHKLNYLVKNRARYTQELKNRGRHMDADYDPFKKPREYLGASEDGVTQVAYHKAAGANSGRLFASGGLSLQSFCREIRHTIAGDLYDDIDMRNAHPVILEHLCVKHEIDCDNLARYIEDRASVLQEIVDANEDMDLARAKVCILSLINGGVAAYKAIDSKTPWLKSFRKEIKAIKLAIADEYESLYESVEAEKEDDENFQESGRDYRDTALNRILCNYENEALMHMCNYLSGRVDIQSSVLCFDGIMVPKVGKGLDQLVAGCEEHLSCEMGFDIKLAVKPMNDGFDLPDEVPTYKDACIDANDPYVWLDFDNQYRGMQFKSLDDCINGTCYDLRRVLAVVEQGSRMFIKKSDCNANLTDIIPSAKKFTDLYFKYETDTGKVKELSFAKYLQYAAKKLKRYRSIDFAPGSDDKAIFNLFSGYRATLLDEYDLRKIKRPLIHLREVICAGNDEHYVYLMRWIAFILQHPDRRTGVVPLLCSETQGTGKNTIFHFLTQNVMGAALCREVIGLQPLLEKHNTVLQGRKLLLVNEASSGRESFMSNFDKLKSLITDSTIWVDPKGKDGFTIKNLLEIPITTNHSDSIRIEESDRRYFALDVSDHRAGDTKYFKKLYKSFTDEAGSHFMTYAIKEFGGNGQLEPPPMTDLKRSMINMSMSNSVRFLMAKPWSAGEPDSDEDSDDDEEPHPGYSADQVYTMYKAWCEAEGERASKKNAFQQKIKNKVADTIVTRKRRKYYQLHLLE